MVRKTTGRNKIPTRQIVTNWHHGRTLWSCGLIHHVLDWKVEGSNLATSKKSFSIRRNDLELENLHILIVDVLSHVKIRIINVYRSFRPPNRMTPDRFFKEQLKVLQNAVCENCFIMGDFNLDARMSNRPDYLRKEPLKLLNDFALSCSFSQMVDFCTWSRTINNVKKSLCWTTFTPTIRHW